MLLHNRNTIWDMWPPKAKNLHQLITGTDDERYDEHGHDGDDDDGHDDDEEDEDDDKNDDNNDDDNDNDDDDDDDDEEAENVHAMMAKDD